MLKTNAYGVSASGLNQHCPNSVFAERIEAETALASGQRLEQPLRMLRGSPPMMPSRAIDRKIEGTVEVEITVAESGSVKSVKVLHSPHELLSAAVVSAVSLWQLAPRIIDGRPTQFTARQKFTFLAR
ncbi:MAG: energy transducer TonB [Ramlibacter sp.]|nr:energy transducer TonB [Ramlibacter sp.]